MVEVMQFERPEATSICTLGIDNIASMVGYIHLKVGSAWGKSCKKTKINNVLVDSQNFSSPDDLQKQLGTFSKRDLLYKHHFQQGLNTLLVL